MHSTARIRWRHNFFRWRSDPQGWYFCGEGTRRSESKSARLSRRRDCCVTTILETHSRIHTHIKTPRFTRGVFECSSIISRIIAEARAAQAARLEFSLAAAPLWFLDQWLAQDLRCSPPLFPSTPRLDPLIFHTCFRDAPLLWEQ